MSNQIEKQTLHEIRTSLALIIGAAQTIESERAEDHLWVDMIQRHAKTITAALDGFTIEPHPGLKIVKKEDPNDP